MFAGQLTTAPNASIPAAFRKRAEDAKMSAAGIAFVTPDGQALFLKRSGDGDHAGEWCFPGGGVEDGEEPADAAFREAIEETGHFPKINMIPLDRRTSAEGVDFALFGQKVERPFLPRLNGEHVEYAWAPLDKPPEPLHPGVRAQLAGDAASEDVAIDREHDGPWMSCMSRDGRRMYVNRTLPEQANIDGKDVDVAAVLFSHEVPEWTRLEELLTAFRAEHGRDPDTKERESIYLDAHNKEGTPSERQHCERIGLDWSKWSAWCRGEESRIEKGPFENQPEDADVRPIDHDHGKLAATDEDFRYRAPPEPIATDSAISLALDRESVREKDRDGRLHVKVTNISKACVNPYKGSEIPDAEKLGLDPNKIYYLLRDPKELEKAADSFNHVQLLRKHIPVSAEDHQPWDVIGATGTDTFFEHPYLKSSLVIWSAPDIRDVESDLKKELSAGYHYRAEMTPGVFDGKAFDGIMRDIVGNHVALVENGRAGPDVVVGDSNEEIEMTNRDLAKKLNAISARQITVGALVSYLKPRLAMDARIDCAKVFDGITGTKFRDSKPVLIERITEQVKDKLAKDASIEGLGKLLDMVEAHELDEVADESVSPEQHRAMEAAAHGHSNLDIPKKVGEEFAEADKGKKFGDSARNFLLGKGLSEDDLSEFENIMAQEKPAEDEESEEEKKAREDKERKAAEDKHAMDERLKNMVTKQAMDEAITAATTATEKRMRDTQQGIRKAEAAVRPFVGELPSTLAFDSAASVYRHALKMLGVANADTLHEDALEPVLNAQRKPGDRSEPRRLATDSSIEGAKSFRERHPEAARIEAA